MFFIFDILIFMYSFKIEQKHKDAKNSGKHKQIKSYACVNIVL